MSQTRQEEFGQLLSQILDLPPIMAMRPDSRLHRVHYDWLEAGEHTQRTVARLSEQLRRFLDDRAWLENKRIMDILHEIESKALSVREAIPNGDFMPLAETSASIELPMERPLFSPPIKPVISEIALDEGDAEVDTTALFTQVVIDKAELARNIRQELQARSQISLGEVTSRHPMNNGLAELIGYLQLAGEWSQLAVDEEQQEQVSWLVAEGKVRQATLPRIIFLRNG
jgi:hypothetical protein